MPSVSLTSHIVFNANDYIDTNWVDPDDFNAAHKSSAEKIKDIFFKEVAARVAFLVLIPVTFICTTVDLTTGVMLGGVYLLTGGYIQAIKKMAYENLHAGSYVFSGMFQQALQTINPRATITSRPARGIITHHVFQALYEKSIALSESENFFTKHMVSRVFNVVSIPIIALTTTVDFLMALIWTPVALIMGGKQESPHFITDYTFRGLSLTGLVRDSFIFLNKTIDPSLSYLYSY